MMANATIRPAKRGMREHPLSWFQERMWLLNRKNPNDVSYNIPVVFLLEGDLDIEVLNRSLTEILKRHETLRARFGIGPRGEPMQIIAPLRPYSLLVSNAQESDAPRSIKENAEHVFDLEKGPIFIGRLLVFGPQRFLLLLNVHHIAADGWSIESILFSELQECYGAFSGGNEPALKTLPVQYTDFAYWQRQQDLSAGVTYWQKHLAGYEASLEMPTDFLRGAHSGISSERFEYRYPREFSQALEKFGQAYGCTMFMCLLAGFTLAVSRYTGREDCCIGTTTSGRILPELEGLIGFFVNILPLRIFVDEEKTVAEFMNSVRSTTLAGFDNQRVPFERIVYSSAIERGDHAGSVVPIVIRHQNFPRMRLEQMRPGGVKFGAYPGFEGYRTATGKGALARCEVELSFTGDSTGLDVEIVYASDLYRPETVAGILRHHEQLMREMMSNGNRRLSELSMFTEADRQRLRVDYNKTRRPIDEPLDFVGRWEAQVRKTPGAIACVDANGSWSFASVADRADTLAAALAARGIGRGDIVAICLERDAAVLAAFLAVWKTGAAYVPLDPSYPESYLRLIMRDADPKLTICAKTQQSKMELGDDACLVIDSKQAMPPTVKSVSLRRPIRPKDLAYIMYTSGSTGTPKGARIPHEQLINWLSGIEANWPFAPGEVIAQKTTIAFAVSVKEIFAGLLNGCPLAFIDTDIVKDTPRFAAALKKCGASRVNLVPSHLQTVLAYLSKEGISLPSLRMCITAGEPLTAETVAMFRSVLPHVRLINNYGCTELNDITYYDTKDFDGSLGFVPIGRPIQNTQLYILDRKGRLVPDGVPGEVHVAGASIALGYHRLETLTRERFIKNRFNPDGDDTLYNTGDVVRYLPDGNLEYLGRWDFQVKVRGFRVDVRHVEKILGEYEGMGIRAVVGENGQLLAFYVEQPDHPIDMGRLRLFLEERLPAYMVPAAFVALSAMPKLPNGKLNRRALNVSIGKLKQSDAYEAPATQTEQTLVELWSEVLETPEDRIGRRAHFFEMGGHSLSATRLVSGIKERLGIEIGLSFVFEYPRLDEIAQYVDNSQKPSDTDDYVILTTVGKSDKSLRRVQVPGLLENKVVLVTGGSRGIGRTAARLLANHGASVAINYLKSDEQARMIKEIIDEDGGTAEIFQGDSTDQNQVKELVGKVRGRFGKIDIVVANAAIGFKITPFIDSAWIDFERKLNDEMKSIFLLCQEVVPEMIERKSGSIIAVSSTMSKQAQPGYTAHSAAKAALDAFVRALAVELGPDGVRINTVAPGLTLTDATATMPLHIKDSAAARNPLRRNGLPRDVAGAILFLASDLSQFMTGAYLPVDGGYTML